MDVAVNVAAGHDSSHIMRTEGRDSVVGLRGDRGRVCGDIISDRMRTVGAEPVARPRLNPARSAPHSLLARPFHRLIQIARRDSIDGLSRILTLASGPFRWRGRHLHVGSLAVAEPRGSGVDGPGVLSDAGRKHADDLRIVVDAMLYITHRLPVAVPPGVVRTMDSGLVAVLGVVAGVPPSGRRVVYVGSQKASENSSTSLALTPCPAATSRQPDTAALIWSKSSAARAGVRSNSFVYWRSASSASSRS